jgi:sugar phosphate isomerase/epimerase
VRWPIGISTGACTHLPILDVLPAIAESGVAGVELGTPPRHFDPWHEEQVAALVHYFTAGSLTPISIHAPFGATLDLAADNPDHRNAAVAAILTTALAMKRVGGRMIVVHPSDLERNGGDTATRLRHCRESLEMLAGDCGAIDMTLAVESPLPHLIGGHPWEFAQLIDGLDPRVAVCLDTGHTFLGRHWHDFVRVSGPRLVHVHAHDNHGRFDDHLVPGDGAIPWHEVARTLRDVNYRGWLMLELTCPGHDPARVFKSAVERTIRLFE